MRTCRYLDDYLDGFLIESERMLFEQHLPVCERCQAEISAQRKFDEFVVVTKSANAIQVRCEQAEVAVRTNIRRRRRIRYAISIAASILIAVAMGAYLNSLRSSQNSAERVASKVNTESNPQIELAADPEVPQAIVELDPDSKYLAVPMETSNSNMTILWLYPTLERISNEQPSSNKSSHLEIFLAGNSS